VVASLVIPRAAADLGASLAPTPSRTAVATAIRTSLQDGVPGGPTREERIDAITEAMLEEQGFSGAETLMDAALLGGIELQAEAQFENEVIDFHHQRLAEATAHQESVVTWMGVVAPPIAIQSLSSALAGTDHAHHRHFNDAAERHRRALIDMLNREFAEQGGSDGWSYRAGRETWERAPAFQYQQPDLGWALSRQKPSLIILAAWLLGGLAFAARAAHRMRVT
jgi:ABC-2 type transport system permease protein